MKLVKNFVKIDMTINRYKLMKTDFFVCYHKGNETIFQISISKIYPRIRSRC